MQEHVEKWVCGAQRVVVTATDDGSPLSLHRMWQLACPVLRTSRSVRRDGDVPSGQLPALCVAAVSPQAWPLLSAVRLLCSARDACGLAGTWPHGGLAAFPPLSSPSPPRVSGLRLCVGTALPPPAPSPLIFPELPPLSLLYIPFPFGICFIEDLS